MIEHISSRASVLPGAEARRNDSPAILIVSLAEKLDIAGGKCACPKKDTDIPCVVSSNQENAAEIRKRLQQLQHFDASSPGLKAELQDLARLLHCRFHSPQKWHVKRAEHWLKQGIFPSRDQVPPALLISDQLRALSKLSSVQCSGKVVNGEQCRRRVGGQKVQNANMTILALSEPEVYLDEQIWHYAVEVLALTLFCASHVDQRWDSIKSWRQRIGALLASSLSSTRTLKGGGPSAEASRIIQAYRAGISPARCWPLAFNNKAFITEILPSRPTSREDCYKELRRVVTSRLSSTEQRDGFVYLYQADNNESYVKIGYTGKDTVQERIDDWEFDCNRISRLIYPNGKALTARVPHAKRIEALCHAELDYVRELWECQACIVTHTEWFRIAVSVAVRVIQKWTIWMQTRPYQNEYLASDLFSSTRNMPAFMDSLAAARDASTLLTVEVAPLSKASDDLVDAKVAPSVLDPKLKTEANTVSQDRDNIKQEPVDGAVEQQTTSTQSEGGPAQGSTRLEDDKSSTPSAEQPHSETIVKVEDETVQTCKVPRGAAVDKKPAHRDSPPNSAIPTA